MGLKLTGPVSGEYFAGNDHVWEFTVTDDDEPADLTDAECVFVMARDGYAPALSTETSPPTATVNIEDLSPPSGVFRVSIDNDATMNLLGTYRYEAQVRDVGNGRSTVLHGYFTFRKSLIGA